MNREEIIEQQNAYYMAGYPSRRSENKMDKDCENFNKTMGEKEQWNKEHYQLNRAKEIIKNLIDDFTAIDGEEIRELEAVKEAEQFLMEE